MVPYCLEVQRIPFGSPMRDFTQIFSPNICNTTQTTATSKVNLTKYLGFTFTLILRYSYRFQKDPSPSLKDQIRLIIVLHKTHLPLKIPSKLGVHFKVCHIFPRTHFLGIYWFTWTGREGHGRKFLLPHNYHFG